jgi:hypothetical protein
MPALLLNAIKKMLMAIALLLLTAACTDGNGDGKKATYVEPSIDYRGRFRKGHVRMPVSTNKNAIKNQNRSRYYYQTRGKYRRKNKK